MIKIGKILKAGLSKFKDSLNLLVKFISSHRLLSLMIAGIIVVLLVMMFVFGRKGTVVVRTEEKQKSPVTINRLEIIVPPGAFPTGKQFLVKEIPKDSDRYRKIVERSGFLEEIYEVVPKDGREELALIPIILRYRIPRKYYLGDDSSNLFLGYMKSDMDVLRRIYGCEINEDDKGAYIQAKVFHTSIVGFSAERPEKFEIGIKSMIERPPTYKPPILIIPGIDENFIGAIPKTKTNENPEGKNLWEFLFPDRSIWVYKYPLRSTRPKIYVDAAKAFFNRNKNDYLVYEAKRLATELKRFPYKFDVMAHGLGGLLIRYAIESDPSITNIRRVVLIDTPNLGSNLANPVYLNLLYGKSAEALAKIYGTDADSVRFIVKNTLDYLEKVNVFWKDLKPDSEFLKTLNALGLRKDVKYLAVAGTSPNFPVKISGTELEKLYPEFVVGKGDGVVTVKSACYNGKIECVKSSHSFSNVYLQPDVLDKIKEFLEEGIEKPEEYVFKDDTFIERTASPGLEIIPTQTILEEATKAEAMTKEENKHIQMETTSVERYIPLNYQTDVLFKTRSDGSQLNLLNSNYGVYVVTNTKVFLLTNLDDLPSTSIVWISDNIHANIFDGKLHLLDSNGLKTFEGDVQKKSIKVNVDLEMNKIVDAFITDDELMILKRKYRKLELLSYPLENMKLFKVLKKFTSIHGHLKFDRSNDSILVITDSEIGRYDLHERKYHTLETTSNILNKINEVKSRGLSFSDAIIFKNLLVILTREYEVYIEDMTDKKIVRISMGDVGSEKLVLGEKRIYILGNKTINFFEFDGNKLKRFPGYVRARKDEEYSDLVIVLDEDENERMIVGMIEDGELIVKKLEVFWR